MKQDLGSNFTLAEETAAATYTGAATEGAGVDHATGPAVSFLLTASAVGTTLDAKVQYSDNGTDWTDDDGASGNDTAITQLDDAGVAQLNVPNPQGRQSRVLSTSVGACVYAVVSVLGPNRHIAV